MARARTLTASSRTRALLVVIAVALSIRLVHLGNPLLGLQGWRQADTAAFARNYYENGYHFLYPQVDWGGDSEGWVESEFPLYSFVVALFYGAFGVSEAFGRLLSILCSLVALVLLYRLVEDVIDFKTALWSTIFCAVIPLNVYYSRAFMPESAMLMASVAAIYFFARWTARSHRVDFFLSAASLSLAALLKIPALYLGLPILYLAWLRFGKKVPFERSIWLYAALVLAPVVLWYAHAHRIYLDTGRTFGIWAYGSDKWGNWGLVGSYGYWNNILFKRLAERNLTWVGFVLFVVGLALPRRSARERVFDFWLAAILVFFIIVGEGNAAHEYYQLPLLLPASVYLGKVYGRFFDFARHKASSVLLTACLLGILVASGLRYVYFYLASEDPAISPHYDLAQEVREKTPDGARLVSFLGGDPSLFYWAHRKGWNARPEEVTDEFLADLTRRGARFAVGCYRNFDRAGSLEAFAKVRAINPSLLPVDYDCFLVPLDQK